MRPAAKAKGEVADALDDAAQEIKDNFVSTENDGNEVERGSAYRASDHNSLSAASKTLRFRPIRYPYVTRVGHQAKKANEIRSRHLIHSIPRLF